MKSIINRIFTKRGGSAREVTTSLSAALARLLPRNQLESLIARTPDRRLLLQTAAYELKRPESEVLAQVAAILGINYTCELAPQAAPQLPSGVSIDELERLGLVPLRTASSGRAMLCCDPLQIRFSSLAGVPMEISLAPWRLIAQLLETLRNQVQSNEAIERAAQERALALKVLAAIIDQCKLHFVESCQLTLIGTSPKYAFQTLDGRSGNGTVDPRIVAGLTSLLCDDSPLPSQIESKCIAPGEYLINWQNSRCDNVIPLVRPASSVQLAESKNSQSPCEIPEQIPAGAERINSVERQVMIVEDNPTFTRVLERFLQRIDVKTSAFESVEAALAALRSNTCRPQVIVADLHLPAKGGDDLIAAVRSLEHLDHVGIIVLTSDDSCDAELKTIQLGADAFIGKNQDPRILCAHVERILTKKGAKRAA